MISADVDLLFCSALAACLQVQPLGALQPAAPLTAPSTTDTTAQAGSRSEVASIAPSALGPRQMTSGMSMAQNFNHLYGLRWPLYSTGIIMNARFPVALHPTLEVTSCC